MPISGFGATSGPSMLSIINTTFHVSAHCSISVTSAIQGLVCDFAMQDAPSYIGYIGDLNVRSIHRAWILYRNGFSKGWKCNYGMASVYSSFTLLGTYMLSESSRCCTVYHTQLYVDHQAHGIVNNHRVTIVLAFNVVSNRSPSLCSIT